MPRRLKVLMSAYACEPHRGSEPEVGWQSALHMAQFHDVTVVTRANNRSVIEAELSNRPGPVPSIVYFDPPAWLLTLKKRGLPVAVFYLLWQLGVRRHVAGKLPEYDLLHHVTFNSIVIPGCWWLCPCPVLLGPLGGGQITPWRFLRGFGWAAPFEFFRSALVISTGFLPHVVLSFIGAKRILVVNQDTKKRIPFFLRDKVETMLETAVTPGARLEPVEATNEGEFTFLWVGRLIKWKGAVLALRALARARREHPGLQLTFVGKGPEEQPLRDLAADLELGDDVRFQGQIPREKMSSLMRSHDAFLFTSLHDTSGNALLEAMTAGLPAIVLNHHGPAEITTIETAIQIPVTTPKETIQLLAEAMVRLARSPELAGRLGRAAQKRILDHFTWPEHAKKLDHVYRQLAG